MGIGIGAKNATVPIFSAEIAPARVRGALVMFWQLWVVAGMLFLFPFYAQNSSRTIFTLFFLSPTRTMELN